LAPEPMLPLVDRHKAVVNNLLVLLHLRTGATPNPISNSSSNSNNLRLVLKAIRSMIQAISPRISHLLGLPT
jgi:hypothetical protein